jgi:hypothetical protein
MFSNKTRSKAHSKKEHNTPTPNTSTSKGLACILTIEDSSFYIEDILTPDNGHIGRNM